MPTSASGKFEVLFRLYGPEKPLYDKTWKLPDIERTDGTLTGAAGAANAGQQFRARHCGQHHPRRVGRGL